MRYLLLIAVLLFSACSIKNYDKTQTKIIIIKSPQLKFADLGYIRNSAKSVELELFSAGVSIQKVRINYLICVDEGCMSRSSFNQKYLNKTYPSDILQNILLSKAIYDGKGMLKKQDGFLQKIKNNDVDITYKVGSKSTFFKDKKNKIILKIKDIK
ncbi:MAG: hypothetical protein JJW00_02715 [Sulfurimonas sp.]|nr:hypothetical protein [Sulfurimonas sp.]